MMQDPEIERWIAELKAELSRQIYKGQTSIEEKAREYDLTPFEAECLLPAEAASASRQ